MPAWRTTTTRSASSPIRVRAERECGKLLKETEKAKGAQAQLVGRGVIRPRSLRGPIKTLRDHGLSYGQSSQFQKLADVPEEIFEARLADSYGIPSAAEIIARGESAKAQPPTQPVRPVDDQALWLWGRLLDFERDGVLARDPSTIMSTMTEPMRKDVERLAPLVASWLGGIH
jgi:hypothetical protein